MKTLIFMRKDASVLRGGVADYPFSGEIPYVKPFIVVQIDESTIPEGLDKNPTVRLKLDELLANPKYQPEDIISTDEEGNETTITPPHYFAVDGVSTKPYPTITINDVTYETKEV